MSEPQVVITRKYKKLNRGLHLIAFALTGGTSAPVTVAKAATNVGYNAQTRKLQQGSKPKITRKDREYFKQHVPGH